MSRILIVGGPRTGKTVLSIKLGKALGMDELAVQHCDELIGVLEWSEASAEVAKWLEAPGPWVVEGVTAVRALRKYLAAHPHPEKPCDILYTLTAPFVVLSKGQLAMTKGHMTIWSGIEDEVIRRGVEMRSRVDDLRV
jgi:hypothetical protein